jgi:hypothetical protein
MKVILITCLIALVLPVYIPAQEAGTAVRNKYYSVEELIQLIERARDAGISDENLQKLEIRDGNQEINVLDYIEQEKLDQLKKDKLLTELLGKKFLTVNDIYKELIKMEPEVIEKLREELVSER